MSKIHSALDFIARRDIPDETDLWSQIAARIERKDSNPMNPTLKLAWTIVLVLLGLVLATTAAYAVYRFFVDPGLQSVSDAGMFTDVNATAQPTVLPTLTPDPASAGTARLLGLEQTQNGITAQLEWVSLLDPRQMFQVSVQGLSTGMELGMPQVSYPGITPQQHEGAILSLNGDRPTRGRYVSYQILRKDNGEFISQVDMQIDIPIMQRVGDQLVQVTNFHFDLHDMPVTTPNGWGGGSAYAVQVNGLEMRQLYSIVTPSYTQARVCFEVPVGGDLPSIGDWVIADATIEFSQQAQSPSPAVTAQSIVQAKDEGDQRCADLRFPQGKSTGDISFSVTVKGLKKDSEKVDGDWRFYTGLVDDIAVPGAPQPASTPTAQTPLEAQTDGDITVTLLSAYADANRLAVTLQLDGVDLNIYGLNAVLTDEEGFEFNSATYMNSPEGQPNVYILTFLPEDMSHSNNPGFSPTVPLAGEHFKGRLNLNIMSASGDQVETAFHFDLDMPVYPALVIEPKQIVQANGIEMRLEKLKITPSYTRAYLCYTKPDPHDWSVSATSVLKIGTAQSSMNIYSILSDPDYGNIGKGRDPDFTPSLRTGRCIKVGYAVGHHNQLETLTLTIPELDLSFPEVIADADVKKAQAKLKTQGIELDYVTFSGNGGGGSSTVIKSKPEGMTDQQVMRLFYEALGYYHRGPWVFTVKITP